MTKAPRPLTAGFTLMELLVVMAIIGILSIVILASLNSARSKGADGAVKSNLNNARAQAELFYDANGQKYVGTVAAEHLCNAAGNQSGVKGIYDFIEAAANSSGATINTALGTAGNYTLVTCHANANGWAISAPLKSYPGMTQPMYCVDYRGRPRITDVTGSGTQPAAGSITYS